jgi:hypothetical protein
MRGLSILLGLLLLAGCEADSAEVSAALGLDGRPLPAACANAPEPGPARALGGAPSHVVFGPCGDLFWIDQDALWHAPPSLDAPRQLASGVHDRPLPTADGTAVAYRTQTQVCMRTLAAAQPLCAVFHAGTQAVAMSDAGPITWADDGHQGTTRIILGPGQRISQRADVGALTRGGAEHPFLAGVVRRATPDQPGDIGLLDLRVDDPPRTFTYEWLAPLSPDGPDGGGDTVQLLPNAHALVIQRNTWITEGDVSMMAPTRGVALIERESGETLARFATDSERIWRTVDRDAWWLQSADGSRLVFALAGGGALQLDANLTITERAGLSPLAISRDGAQLVAIEGQQFVRLDLATEQRTPLGPEYDRYSVRVSADTQTVARVETCAGCEGTLWRTHATGPPEGYPLSGPATILAVDDAGRVFFEQPHLNHTNLLPSVGPVRAVALQSIWSTVPVIGGFVVLSTRYPGRLTTLNDGGEATALVPERADGGQVDRSGRRFAAVRVANAALPGLNRTLVVGAMPAL